MKVDPNLFKNKVGQFLCMTCKIKKDLKPVSGLWHYFFLDSNIIKEHRETKLSGYVISVLRDNYIPNETFDKIKTFNLTYN